MSDEFPKGVAKPEAEDIVNVTVSEEWARQFERELLIPRGLHLAGPILFSDDDVPSYIIGFGPVR